MATSLLVCMSSLLSFSRGLRNERGTWREGSGGEAERGRRGREEGGGGEKTSSLKLPGLGCDLASDATYRQGNFEECVFVQSLSQHVGLLNLAVGMENCRDQSLTVTMFPLLF